MKKASDYLCLTCNIPMEEVKKSVVSKEGKEMSYLKRRIKCPICDYEESVFGSSNGWDSQIQRELNTVNERARRVKPTKHEKHDELN